MTEWYHSQPYVGDFGKTVYSSNVGVGSAWLWADEYNAENGAEYFSHLPSAPSVFDSKALQNASVDGVTAFGNGYQFITGYLNKVSLNLEYSLIGTGPANPQPTLRYVYEGSPRNASLPSPLVTYFVDPGTPWSISSELPGSGNFDRWVTPQLTSGIAGSISQGASLNYFHQFLISVSFLVSGGGSPSPPNFAFSAFGSTKSTLLSDTREVLWADEGSYVLDNPLNGSTPTERWVVANRLGPVDEAGLITATYAHQYLLSVYGTHSGGGADAASRWYDSGSVAAANTSAVYSRSDGVGYRVSAYSLDSGSQVRVAPSSGTISLPVVMVGPHSIVFYSVKQYQVTLDPSVSHSMLEITSPTIVRDGSWYDSGTVVTLACSQVWNSSSDGSRLSAVGYSVDSAHVSLATRGNGTFNVSLAVEEPHRIGIDYVTQYPLSIAGGSNVSTAVSPTGDRYYDNGTKLTVTTDYTWNVVSGTQRQNLIGYSMGGGPVHEVIRRESGAFSTPAMTLNSSVTLAFNSAAQYFVSFSFTDHSGSHHLVPASLILEVDGARPAVVPDHGLWLDNGSTFTVSSVLWEGVDVNSAGLTYRVNNAPLPILVHAKVYDEQAKVIDYLGLPAVGAKADTVLANGTRISKAIGLDGTISLQENP